MNTSEDKNAPKVPPVKNNLIDVHLMNDIRKDASPASTSVKVLLVEDNVGDARIVREYLKETSPGQFDLTCVERLTEALAWLDENSVDVILLDLSLPDATGLDTIVQMRTTALNLPIVVLTGQNDESLALQAVREGAQDYLLKRDLDSDLLKRVLRYAIERKRADQAQRESEERFRALVQHSTDIITIIAADGTVLYQSPSLVNVMGFRPESILGSNIAGSIHPDDLPMLLRGMESILDQAG